MTSTDPLIDSFSQFGGKPVRGVRFPHMINGEGILDVFWGDGSFLSFPVEVKVRHTSPSWASKIELWAGVFHVLKTPNRVFYT